MDTNIINKVVNEYLDDCLDCEFDDMAIIHMPDFIDGIRAVTWIEWLDVNCATPGFIDFIYLITGSDSRICRTVQNAVSALMEMEDNGEPDDKIFNYARTIKIC